MSGTGGLALDVLPVGDAGLLVEVADLVAVLALDAALRPALASRAGPWRDVTDIVPAARTVLVVTEDSADLAALERAVREVARGVGATPSGAGAEVGVRAEPGAGAVAGAGAVFAAGAVAGAGAVVRHGGEAGGIPGEVVVAVRYDGPDLADVAAFAGLTTREVVAAHTGMPWRVAFGGFAPGFAYLVGGDPRLVVPRRAAPRPSVPAGSVGLAGEFSGVYPRSSPGGWQLIGTTRALVWDVDRDPPALFTPGATVRFVEDDAGS